MADTQQPASGGQGYREVVNETGRVFRVGEEPATLLGFPRWVPIVAAWVAMMLAGLLEYTWGALSGSLQAQHHWDDAPVFWLFSVYVIFESFVQPVTGYLRGRGILPVRWAVILGGVICGIVAYGWLTASSAIWEAYLSYAVLGGIGSGMVYSSCINIVAKWYPDMKGWRTGFVNGGWAYGSVPFIIGIGVASHSGAFGSGSGAPDTMSPSLTTTFILAQGVIMTVGIVIAAFFMKDPPKNWWPSQVDPLNWSRNKRAARDLLSNPPALKHYHLREMWYTPQAKWMGIQFALYVGCSLFGVAYYYPFAQAMNLGAVAVVSGAAGFALADGIFRPIYGYISEFVGRRRVMYSAYTLNAIFLMLALMFGLLHLGLPFAICAVISGGLSGANFPMTAAMTADYYGETNNALNYGSIYQWKALGGSFAGGLAALVMTGTLWGPAHFNWPAGFVFGAALGLAAAIIVFFLCKAPTVEQMRAAEARAAEPEARVATA